MIRFLMCTLYLLSFATNSPQKNQMTLEMLNALITAYTIFVGSSRTRFNKTLGPSE